MLTRMQHPDHGFMYVTDAGDIERLKRLGWSIEAAAKAPEAPAEPAQETSAEPKRRGRPPGR